MATKLIHHLKLIIVIYRFWIMRFLEFRSDILIWTVLSLVWSLVMFATVELIFGQVSTIAGWTKQEVLTLVLVQNIFTNLLWIFILPSLLKFATTVRTGNLDFYLLKPVSSRFLLSFSEFQFTNYIPTITLIIWLILFLHINKMPVNFGDFLGFTSLFLMGIFLIYCVFFTIATISFWLINLFNLEDLFDSILGIGRFPVQIFNSGLLFFFSFVIPIAYISTFPVQFLLGRGELINLLIGLSLVFIFFNLSQWFWNFALRRYSSASS